MTVTREDTDRQAQELGRPEKSLLDKARQAKRDEIRKRYGAAIRAIHRRGGTIRDSIDELVEFADALGLTMSNFTHDLNLCQGCAARQARLDAAEKTIEAGRKAALRVEAAEADFKAKADAAKEAKIRLQEVTGATASARQAVRQLERDRFWLDDQQRLRPELFEEEADNG